MTSKISRTQRKARPSQYLYQAASEQDVPMQMSTHTHCSSTERSSNGGAPATGSGLPPLASPEELLASLPAGEDGAAESAHLLGKSFPCLT